jgi:transcriptional regulator with XRE-family HTH domain
MSSIGKRIDQIINHFGLTKYSFAKSLKTSGTRISNIVNGRNKPDFDLLVNIINTFNICPSWLLLEEGKMLNNDSDNSELGSAKKQFNFLITSLEKFDSIKLINLMSRDDISEDVKLEINKAYSNATKVKTLYLNSLNKSENISLPILKAWELKNLIDHVIEIYNRYIWLTDYKLLSHLEKTGVEIDLQKYFEQNEELYSNYKNFADSFETLEEDIIKCLVEFSQFDPHGVVHSSYKKINKKTSK